MNNKNPTTKQFNIRKKIAKHGENSIIVIPKLLQGELRPSTIIEVNIKSLSNPELYPYTITKKIARHGINSIIVIPKFLQPDLQPRMVVEMSIKVLKEAEDEVNKMEEKIK